MSTRIEGFCIELSLTCPRCLQPVPVNGLTESVACPHCSTVSTLKPEQWTDVFDPETLAEVSAMKRGSGRKVSVSGELDLAGSMVRLAPRCEACKTKVPVEALDALAEAGGQMCSCGAHLLVRLADSLAQSLVPGARWVVGEALAGASDGTGDATEPVLFACMGCGGSLSVDGSTRTVACGYCSASSFLPDALWNRFHPVPQLHDFFIVAPLDQEARWRMRIADDDQAQRLGRTKPLPRDVFERLASSRDYELRAAVGGNPALPIDLLERLCADPDDDVRQAVAINPATPEAQQRALLADNDNDVRMAPLKRPDLSVAFLTRLVQDGDWRVRQLAVADPRAPQDALARVAADESDNDVLEVLARRSDLTVQVLAALAQNGDSDAQNVAARHPDTPPHLLTALADCYDREVRATVAQNPSTPAAGLRVLVEGRGGAAGELAEKHPTYVAYAARRRRLKLAVGVAVVMLALCAGLVGLVVALASGALSLA
jgi:DNA-directed RNA polymerase subunit RPC12/RpoP